MNGVDDRLANFCRIAEAHFAFCRMDVHIHVSRVESNGQEGDRVLPFHEGGVVTLSQRVGDDPALNGTAIYKYELLAAGLPAYPSSTNPASHVYVSPIRNHFEQFFHKLGVVKVPNPIADRTRDWQLQQKPVVAHKGEANRRMRKGMQKKLVFDVSRFCRLGPQKFSACRHIEK